jgi:hypothetical protein
MSSRTVGFDSKVESRSAYEAFPRLPRELIAAIATNGLMRTDMETRKTTHSRLGAASGRTAGKWIT